MPSRYFLGQQIEGKVVHCADFGAFVELEEGVEGLVHISELAHDIMSDAYLPGAKLKVEIISLDPHEQKIGLSQLRDGEERAPIQEGHDPSSTFADVIGGDLLSQLHPGMTFDDEPAAAPATEAPAEDADDAAPEAE